MTAPLSPLARRSLPLIDLTNVEDACTPAMVDQLCTRVLALPVRVAAVCLRPAFVRQARLALAETGVRVAAVVNFPDAAVTPEQVASNLDGNALAVVTAMAVADGAGEIDLVFPWRSFLAGDHARARQVVEVVRAACGPARLKVILESGIYPDASTLRAACDLVIDAGADFLKTSTTRIVPAATPDAVRVMCAASRDVGKTVGIKVSGGIRTPGQVREYLDIIADLMGLNWIQPENVRIGASRLLDALLTGSSPPASIVKDPVNLY